jgi:16S rRNA (adenine1518-N6/adenine1519-N6)-dimethyltransferase
MYQYEFAMRMIAQPDTEDYSRLSIAVQYFADVELLEVVPRSAFSSPPEVQSAIVKITPRPPLYKVKDEEFFMNFIKVIFSQRRKKLRNAIVNNAVLLRIDDPVRVLKKLPPDVVNKRAEALAPEMLAKLAEIITNEKI